MARRLPHLDAKIYPVAAPPYATIFHGFGREDAVRELYDRRDELGAEGQSSVDRAGSQVLRVSKVQLDSTVAWPYGGLGENEQPEAAVYIPAPFGQLMPAPLWDTTQTCDLNYFEPIGTWTSSGGVNNYWNDQMEMPGLPQPVLIMTNGTPLIQGEYTGLKSRFNVPWNAVMCFALWRADPPSAAVTRTCSLTAIDLNPDPNIVQPDSGTDYIVVNGSPLPEVGDTITIVDTGGASSSGTVETVVGIPPSQTTDGTWHYRITFTPAAAAAAASINWSATWAPPANYKYGTKFYFGTTATRGFCLELPYGSDAVLWMRDQTYTSNQWRQLRPDRGTRLQTGNIYNQQIKAGRDVQYNFIWLKYTGTGVAVSTDGFVSNCGFWSTQVEGPSATNPQGVCLHVPRGPVEFRHNAGAWGVAWMPINHPASMTVDGPVTRLPFDYDEYVDHATVLHRLPARMRVMGLSTVSEEGEPVLDSATGVATNGQVYSRVPAGGHGFEWRVTMTCDVQTDTFDPPGLVSAQQKNPITSPLNYTHAVVPELHAVRYWTWPGTLTTVQGAAADLEVVNGELCWSMDEIGTSGHLVLEDVPTDQYPDGQQRDQFFTHYRPRLIVLKGRWLDEAGEVVEGTDAQLYTGMLGLPDTKNSGHYLTAQIQDEVLKALETTSDGRVPPFDGWRVQAAIMWILDHVGIRFDPANIEDTGLSLTEAAAGEDPLWYAEDGRQWRDLLEEMCLFDYMGSLWIGVDGSAYKGCYYCGVKRVADEQDADWAPLHSLHGWGSTACLAADVATAGNPYGVERFITLGAAYKDQVPTGTPEPLTHEGSDFSFWGHLVEEEYFNHCRIKGAKHMGRDDPMSVEFTYWPSVCGDQTTAYALGYKKSQNQTYEWATDYATLYRVGRALFYRQLAAPVFCDVTIPFAPELGPRATVAIYGHELERRGMSACRWRVLDLTHKMDRHLGVWRTELHCRYLGVVGA